MKHLGWIAVCAGAATAAFGPGVLVVMVIVGVFVIVVAREGRVWEENVERQAALRAEAEKHWHDGDWLDWPERPR